MDDRIGVPAMPVAIVTGGGGALGKGICMALADVQRVFAEVADEHGSIDALVNCAGGAMALKVRKGPLVESMPDEWDRLIGVNLYGTFNCCHTAARHMKKAGGGIVSIASGAGLRGGPPTSRQSGAAVYSATKAGVIAFTQALAQELGPL